jgi:hypothetical protein
VADHVRGRCLCRGVVTEPLVQEIQYFGLPSAEDDL